MSSNYNILILTGTIRNFYSAITKHIQQLYLLFICIETSKLIFSTHFCNLLLSLRGIFQCSQILRRLDFHVKRTYSK